MSWVMFDEFTGWQKNGTENEATYRPLVMNTSCIEAVHEEAMGVEIMTNRGLTVTVAGDLATVFATLTAASVPVLPSAPAEDERQATDRATELMLLRSLRDAVEVCHDAATGAGEHHSWLPVRTALLGLRRLERARDGR